MSFTQIKSVAQNLFVRKFIRWFLRLHQLSCTAAFQFTSSAQLSLVTMSMTLFLGRIHCLHPSLTLNRTTPFASSKSPTEASPPNPHSAVQYLVQSCGLSSEKALKASKYIQHLKSFDKSDAVLQFLREIGISEADIKTAVSRDARILCSHVENNLRPNIAKLQELGFSIEDISGIIACNPYMLLFVPKIDFLMGVLGSVENISLMCNIRGNRLLHSSLEKVLMPNLSFLQEQCGFSPHQLIQLSKAQRLICSKPDVLKIAVERADKLGIARSSPNFINALLTVSYQKQCIIDAKLDNFRSMGFSQEEVALMISKAPMLLRVPEKLVGSKMEYLIKEAGCDKIDVVKYPALLSYSLENRLIPRNIVRKLLMSKGFPVAIKFPNFIQLSEEKFLKNFVQKYEQAIPGLYRAYADSSTGKIGGVESFKSILS